MKKSVTLEGNLVIKYIILNLVRRIRRPGSLPTKYTWLSDGTKLSVRSEDGSGYEYHGSLIYRIEKDTLRLEGTSFNGGRIILTQTAQGMQCVPYYFLTDHLGSVRVVVDSSSGKVVERNDYLPYGLRWTDASRPVSDNRYRFNGKEEQVTGDVGYLDYGARMYNPRICRWTTQDPLSEMFRSESQYAYCSDNPVLFIDPIGLAKETKDGTVYTDPEEIRAFLEELERNQGKGGQSREEVFMSIAGNSCFGFGNNGFVTSFGWNAGYAVGALYRQLGSTLTRLSFFERFRHHYTFGMGQPIYLTKEEVDYLVKKGKVVESSIVELPDGTFSAQIDFYDSDFELRYVFGRSHLTYEMDGEVLIPLSFTDFYDFDSKPWGKRSLLNEIITRIYGTFIPGTGYEIKYYYE